MYNSYKLSVVVPIYNVEDYLESCLLSLINQESKYPIEYILINDKSTDKSHHIIQETLNNNPNWAKDVKYVINPENKGLVLTRRVGVDLASGEYIIQCDSDDWVDRGLYEAMIEMADQTNADIVGCNLVDEYKGYSKLRTQKFPEKQVQICNMLNGDPHYAGSLCNRMFRTQFYKENAQIIPSDISMHEDLIITLKLHLEAKCVKKVEGYAYHYRHRPKSITTKLDNSYIISMIKVANLISDLIGDNQLYNRAVQNLKKQSPFAIYL